MLRFASLPIDMDIASLRLAILNYIVAQQREDRFLVRIDDVTINREDIKGRDSEIMMILEKFAIKHDLVYHQSEHLNIYQSLALRVLKKGRAFICNSNLEEIKKRSKESFIAIKEPKRDIIYSDIIKGRVVTPLDEVGAFIILKSDGTPTDIFASACDDMLSGINLIIRDKQEEDRTPKEVYIKESLDYLEDTKYAHIYNQNENNITIKSLFKQGFIADAILNYLTLLGYKNPPKEIFTLPEAIRWFDLNQISNSYKFDIDRLRYINREHIKRLDDKELSKVFGFADSSIGKLAKLYLNENSTLNELESRVKSIFKPKDFNGSWAKEMRIIESIILDSPMIDNFNEFKEYIRVKSGLEGESLSKPLQILLTGSEDSPKLSEIYPLIKSYILEVAS